MQCRRLDPQVSHVTGFNLLEFLFSTGVYPLTGCTAGNRAFVNARDWTACRRGNSIQWLKEGHGASDADDAGKEGADAETDGCHTENNSLPRLVVVK